MARWNAHKVVFNTRRHDSDKIERCEMRAYAHRTAKGAVEACRRSWGVLNADIVSLHSVTQISVGRATKD